MVQINIHIHLRTILHFSMLKLMGFTFFISFFMGFGCGFWWANHEANRIRIFRYFFFISFMFTEKNGHKTSYPNQRKMSPSHAGTHTLAREIHFLIIFDAAWHTNHLEFNDIQIIATQHRDRDSHSSLEFSPFFHQYRITMRWLVFLFSEELETLLRDDWFANIKFKYAN